MTAEEADNKVETFLESRFGVSCDFEISDSIRKLEEDKLVVINGAGDNCKIRALPVDEVVSMLAQSVNCESHNFFQHGA